jgi:hypothetical protein
MALCACVACDDWAWWAINASEFARGFLEDRCGPCSAGGMELEYQALDLHELTGVQLRQIVSIDEDDVEGLEEMLKDEFASKMRKRAAGLGLDVVTEGTYRNFSFNTKNKNELILVSSQGKPVGWSDAGWEGIEGLLDEIEMDKRNRTLEASELPAKHNSHRKNYEDE